MRRALLSLALFAALGPAARADVIHFANGRTVEGRVVERSATTLTIEVPGGQLTLPVDQVARVEARRAPQDDLADRTRKTDMGDPDAVTRLAEWAASRGLSEEARQLEAHADGVRLERQVEAARAAGTASAWLDVLAWAEAKEHGKVVLVWLVQQALEVDPQDPEALETNLRLARLDETPRVEPPSLPPPPSPRRGPPPPSRGAADQERIKELEAELADQEAEAEELRNRVDRLENQRRPLRRRRLPANPPIQPGLFLVPAPPPPAPPPPPPPPVGGVPRR